MNMNIYYDEFNKFYEWLNTEDGQQEVNKFFANLFRNFVDFKDVQTGDKVLKNIKDGNGLMPLGNYENGITWCNFGI